MKTTLREAAGSLLVVGLSGTELTALERAWLKLVRPGGVILFRRNIAEVKQTRALLDSASALCAINAFRFVDVEGGTVDRLKDALAPVPSAQAVAKAELALAIPHGMQGGGKPAARSLAFEHGSLIARGVRAFGFNTTLAPVMDLALPDSAKVMGTRSPAETAASVVKYARAFLAGLKTEGEAGCGKHFPGLGGGRLDSHHETPEIQRSWRDLWNEDLVPYRELNNELPMVMVNHASYPRTMGGGRPASVSKYWVSTVLRKRIGYKGIVFSDDLEMGGILKFMPIDAAAVEATHAGIDLMEICHSPELILRAYEALLTEGERSPAFARLLIARAHRTAKAKARLFTNEISKGPTPRQFEALRSRVLGFGEMVMNLQERQA